MKKSIKNDTAYAADESVQTIKKKYKQGFIYEIRKNKFLYLMTLPGILFFIIFSYLPMCGLVIAFQDFNYMKGILKSKFIGFQNFIFLFNNSDALRATFNTVYLNVLWIITGTIFSVLIAVILSEIGRKNFAKISQTIIIFPHFLSWTIISLFLLAFLSSDTGFINEITKVMGMKSIDFYTQPKYWTGILVILKLWQNAGFSSIIYTATIAGIDLDIYEAADIDGANRLQKIWYITLPMLKVTVILLTLFSIGRIFNGDFGMIYALVRDNSLLFPTTDVIDTFVFRAMRTLGDYGMSTAAGLYQSVVGFILVIISNSLARKFSPDAAIY